MSLSLSRFEQLRQELTAHPIAGKLDTADAVRTFMRFHVFAVWAVMSLLKRLQQDLTWVTSPWMPRPDKEYVRFVNELVLAYESDEDGRGGYASHFDIYLEAMEEVGADTLQIKTFLSYMEATGDIYQALELSRVPEAVHRFVEQTVQLAATGELYQVCADYFFVRPALNLPMFQVLLDEAGGPEGGSSRLLHYLHRQIELESKQTRTRGERLLNHLLDGDPERGGRAYKTAQDSLRVRLDLYDAVLKELKLETAINR